jgi:hypothetical protein
MFWTSRIRIRSVSQRYGCEDPDPTFHFDADPDPTFHFDADPDSDPVADSKFFHFYLQQYVPVNIFLASVLGVIIFNILDIVLNSFGKKH